MYVEAKPYLVRGLEFEPDNLDAVAALAESEEGLGDLERAEALASACWPASPSTRTRTS